MTPLAKFAQIDARLAALEAAAERLTQAIETQKAIVSATVAPTPAKRRGRPPKAA